MTEHARHTDPTSSHEKMTAMARESAPRQHQTMRALDSLSVTGDDWWTAAQITARANRMFTDKTRQERDVSRTLTTLWRNGLVVRQTFTPTNGRALLHFRMLRRDEVPVVRPQEPRRASPALDACENCGHVKGEPLGTPASVKADPPWSQEQLF